MISTYSILNRSQGSKNIYSFQVWPVQQGVQPGTDFFKTAFSTEKTFQNAWMTADSLKHISSLVCWEKWLIVKSKEIREDFFSLRLIKSSLTFDYSEIDCFLNSFVHEILSLYCYTSDSHYFLDTNMLKFCLLLIL